MNSATPALPPVIQALGLQVSAGKKTLLRDIGLRIAPGERVALVGHNGAGKSTLLRALTGFMGISRGSLQVLGTELAGGLPAVPLRALRCRVAQVHQGLHLVARLSVLDNVLIGGAGRQSAAMASALSCLRHWPADERRAAHIALARVGLGWAAGRRTDTLSGGERQKVAIARALHQQPALLLADEPTASLDAQAADEIARLLSEVAAERGAALVSVVHDLDLLPRLADRAIALRQGVVVADVAVDANTPTQMKGLLS